MNVVTFGPPAAAPAGTVETRAILAALSRSMDTIRQSSDIVRDSALPAEAKVKVLTDLKAAALHLFAANLKFLESAELGRLDAQALQTLRALGEAKPA